MTVKEESILDKSNYEPPSIVAESIRSNKETTPGSNSQQQAKRELPRKENDDEKERIDITKFVPEDQKHLVVPAGVGGAVLGLVLGGPIVSALTGFGAAYAVRKENGVGDAARALGEITMSVQNKATEIEDRHRYYERSVNAINQQCEKSKRSVVYKTKQAVVSSWQAVEDCARRNQLLERGVEGTGKGAEYVAKAFSNKKKTSTTNVEKEESELFFEEEPTSSDAYDKYQYTKMVDSTHKK
mmetsp:Transcript_24759/g.40512  ORF Transcript_24759/g.40512 Transcript_24759/m.40512 type:complete len:242 (+) Transcript_24759:81-806(+)|eukprot:CAMPEP_0178834510 /NCGR_PEP_ID=MMETSP0746-20121128/11126_1 /TAXON_ID=913974 /ORGANISM="Nitzschia punctata, Strain CCMP561" /LENGTH=241 /DNA_ID=CAMNT_0020497011 /DNA_START=38 /DNA_END=763 /DNA_ORIENTATION=-